MPPDGAGSRTAHDCPVAPDHAQTVRRSIAHRCSAGQVRWIAHVNPRTFERPVLPQGADDRFRRHARLGQHPHLAAASALCSAPARGPGVGPALCLVTAISRTTPRRLPEQIRSARRTAREPVQRLALAERLRSAPHRSVSPESGSLTWRARPRTPLVGSWAVISRFRRGVPCGP